MKYEGVKFVNAGKEYVVPALGIQQARDNKDSIATYYSRAEKVKAGTFDVTELADDIPVIAMAIRRNYPDIKDEEVADFVDFNNYNSIMGAILGTSSLPKIAAEVSGPK